MKKKGVLSFFTMLLVSVIVLAGCGEKNLSKSEIIDGVDKSTEKMFSITEVIDMELGPATEDQEKDFVTSKIDIDMEYADRKVSKIFGKINFESEKAGQQIDNMIYYDGSRKYIKEDGQWIDLTDSEDFKINANYINFSNILKKEGAKFRMEKNDEGYLLSYEGKDKELVKKIMDLYPYSIVNVDKKDIKIKLKYTIDRSTLTISEVYQEVEGFKLKDSKEKYLLKSDIEFKNYNKVKKIIRPENLKEIKNEDDM